jgi:general secretion pathway protein M
MIATLPTGRQGRLLALGLLLVAIALAYAAVAAPLMSLYADRADTVELRRLELQRLNNAVRELPALQAKLATLRASAASSKVTLEGTSDAVAAAALQGRIEELAASSGATIGSSESLPAETQGTYRRLGQRVTLSGGYDAIVKLLAALEQTTPPVIIDNLQIHALQRRVGAAVSTLDASLDVYGFRAVEAAGAAKS